MSFHNVYAPLFAPLRWMAKPTPFLPPFFPSPGISLFWGTLIAITFLWDSRGTSDPGREEVFNLVICSDLFPLNDPDTPTLLHISFGSRSFPDISFAPSSLALSCSWEVLQDLGSDHLPILLSVPLSQVFFLSECPPSFNFQKARWDDFAYYFDSHCPSAEEYWSLSLSSATALFTSLTLNAAKSSIPFGRIKRHPKAWWSPEVEGAVSERRKAYISASRRALSVIAKAKAEAWQTTYSSLSSIIPIHKMGKPLDYPASFRPISLPSCVSKLFERIILSRLFFYWNLIPFSFPARPVSAPYGLH